MAKIVEYCDIPIDDLVLGMAQVRTHPGKGIRELAHSIETQGLLQPIVVCPARADGKWEILVGQRRFLAHRHLKRDCIPAAVLDERVSKERAKAISITENLIRRRLSGKELKDGILYLYNIYASMKDVATETGLPYEKVRGYVKYPRLVPELKKLVDNEEVDVNAALKAQDASCDEDHIPNVEDAIRLARSMTQMSGVQQKKVAKERREHPDRSVEAVIEDAKSASKVVQVIATVTQSVHAAVRKFAREEGINQDEAAATLIEDSLVGRGFLEE